MTGLWLDAFGLALSLAAAVATRKQTGRWPWWWLALAGFWLTLGVLRLATGIR